MPATAQNKVVQVSSQAPSVSETRSGAPLQLGDLQTSPGSKTPGGLGWGRGPQVQPGLGGAGPAPCSLPTKTLSEVLPSPAPPSPPFLPSVGGHRAGNSRSQQNRNQNWRDPGAPVGGSRVQWETAARWGPAGRCSSTQTSQTCQDWPGEE